MEHPQHSHGTERGIVNRAIRVRFIYQAVAMMAMALATGCNTGEKQGTEEPHPLKEAMEQERQDTSSATSSAQNRAQDSLAQKRETNEITPQRERANAPEMYNGHEVHIGPRGGRYYINSSGRKVYIK